MPFSNTPTASSQSLALIAFVLAGASFTSAKTVRSPMTVEKKHKNLTPPPMDHKKTTKRGKDKIAKQGLEHRPVTLQTASNVEDLE